MTTSNQCMQLLYEYGLLKNTVIALHPTTHSQYVIRLALKNKQTKKNKQTNKKTSSSSYPDKNSHFVHPACF